MARYKLHPKGEYGRAIVDLTKAIELNPQNAVYYNWRGEAYRAKGDCERAIADESKAIELNPLQAEYYINRGVSYHAKGIMIELLQIRAKPSN